MRDTILISVLRSPEEEGILPPDCLWLKLQYQLSSKSLAYLPLDFPSDFGLPGFHNGVSQFLKETHSLSLSFHLHAYRHPIGSVSLENSD